MYLALELYNACMKLFRFMSNNAIDRKRYNEGVSDMEASWLFDVGRSWSSVARRVQVYGHQWQGPYWILNSGELADSVWV